jgi:DNA-binding response OmpR family regulator
MNILLIEDNLEISRGLEYSLKMNNYNVQIFSNINDAKRFLEHQGKCDLVLLDVTLPDGNGFDLYKNTIKKLQIPTIFLTAKDGEDDIVKGLNIGAEDYITKPFSTKELLARVNKVLARNKNANIIKIKNIKYDVEKMEVYRNDKKIKFTPIEIKILNLLFMNINSVVTRVTLLDYIYEWTGNDVDNHTITVYMRRIRDKLYTDIIKTVKGVGYRIDEEQ